MLVSNSLHETEKNTKNKPVLSRVERKLLNQRGIIKTVIGHLKHCFQVWHTRDIVQ